MQTAVCKAVNEMIILFIEHLRTTPRDQAIWIREFIPAFEKMVNNGYAPDEFDDGPDQFSEVICSHRENITNVHCY